MIDGFKVTKLLKNNLYLSLKIKTMNLLKNLFMLFITALLVSCNSSDDNNVYLFNNANLSGTYEVTYIQSTETQTTNFNGAEIVSVTTNIGDTFEVDFTFFEDGNYLVNGLYRNVFTVVVDGDLIQEDSNIVVVDNEEGTYTTNGETLKLILDEEIHNVIHFNENEIRFTFEEMWVENGDTFVLNEEIRMIRQ